MEKKLLYTTCTLLFITFSFGQSLWTKITNESATKIVISSKMQRASMPEKYELYSLDFNTLKKQLSNTKNENKVSDSNVTIAFPNAEGQLENYKVYEAPVIDEALSAKYPDIKSYVGKGINDKTATIRFSISPYGLNTMTLSSEKGTSFIDTYTYDLNSCIVYKKSDSRSNNDFKCFTDSSKFPKVNTTSNEKSILRASDGKFRTFRLAMACTIEYAAFHVSRANITNGTLAQKKTAVLAAMNATMTRVNGIYERDMSMRMVIIANNEDIIFIDSDNFTDDDANLLIDEGQTQITNIIGNDNFDIGHTVSTGGGGLAGPTPCVNGQKASGITGSSSPVNDSYDIDYVAHEMGHQFGAGHTFNGDQGSCQGNRDDTVSVEPGSGTTIMAYAGICGAQDVQPNSDAHFHTVSIDEMIAQINGRSNCAATIMNNNSAPVSNAGADYTIPKGTAFVLRGSGSDANNDALTYCWEQLDKQISTQPPIQTATGGPNYRSKSPTSSPDRYMPTLADVVAGNLVPKWEVTPSVARTLNFALTVRDNKTPNGGQTKRDDMKITVNGTAGPFVVTSQSTTGISYQGSTNQTFLWDVAGTNANGVNTANVKITLSTDNGLTFPTVLSASTPNDGTEVITIPAGISSTNCRIKIEAVNNIFYAVNKTKFAITNALATSDFEFQGFTMYPNPNNGSFTIKLTSNSENIKINVHDLRGRAIFEKNYSNNGNFNQNINLNDIPSGIYLVTITDGTNKSIKRIAIQ